MLSMGIERGTDQKIVFIRSGLHGKEKTIIWPAENMGTNCIIKQRRLK